MKTAATTLLFCVLCSVLTWNLAKLPQTKETDQKDSERGSITHRISAIAYLYETGELDLARLVVANQLCIFYSDAESARARDEIGREIVGFYKEIDLEIPDSFISRYPLPENATERDFKWIKEWALENPNYRAMKGYSEPHEIRKYEAEPAAAGQPAPRSESI